MSSLASLPSMARDSSQASITSGLCVRACVRECVHACMRACVRVVYCAMHLLTQRHYYIILYSSIIVVCPSVALSAEKPAQLNPGHYVDD